MYSLRDYYYDIFHNHISLIYSLFTNILFRIWPWNIVNPGYGNILPG